MAKIKHGMADFRVEYDDGDSVRDITQIVESVSLDGDVGEAYRTLGVDIINTEDGRERNLNIKNGETIYFFNHDEELFRGRIFAHDVDETGSESLTCYDNAYFLTVNDVNEKFSNRKASQIFHSLAGDLELPVGSIADTGYVIPKLKTDSGGKNIYEIVEEALEKTRNNNGRRFFLISEAGEISLKERSKEIVETVFEAGVNIESASYDQSIEDLRNRLVMVGGEDNEFREVRESQDLINEFGRMESREESTGSDVTASQIKQEADEQFAELSTIDDSAKITALGVNAVTAGKSVYVLDSMTGIKGGYMVEADSHTFSDGKHTMDLDLTASDAIPKMEVVT